MRDARGSAVAALTWVLWKGRNRLQKTGSYQSQFFGPNFVPNVLKKNGERLRAGSEFFATSDFLGKNSASLKYFKIVEMRRNANKGFGKDLMRWRALFHLPSSVVPFVPPVYRTLHW